jgi:hypothetical protein
MAPGSRNSPDRSFHYVTHIANCDLLTKRDKTAVLTLLGQTNCPVTTNQVDWQVQDWKHVSTIQGVDIYRNSPAQPQRVYKTRGHGALERIAPR